MSIHKIGSDLIRTTAPQGARAAGSGDPEETEEVASVRRPDRIDISAEGRELAAKRTLEDEEVSESQLQEFRERIRDGFYSKPSIAERIAQRLLSDGIIEILIP